MKLVNRPGTPRIVPVRPGGLEWRAAARGPFSGRTPCHHGAAPDTPRAADDEVMSVPVGAALQCTPGLVPLLRRCRDAYLGQRRAAERAQVGLSGGLEADELGELAEAVQATTEVARSVRPSSKSSVEPAASWRMPSTMFAHHAAASPRTLDCIRLTPAASERVRSVFCSRPRWTRQ